MRRDPRRLLFVALLLVAPSSAATLPPEPEQWLTGLRLPVTMAWAPDGMFFYAEKELGNGKAGTAASAIPAELGLPVRP